MDEVPRVSRDTIEAVEGVHLTPLAAGERMSAQHFHVEPGAVVPEHSHPHEQIGYVVRGSLTFAAAGSEFVVGAGDSFCIPPEEPHEARNLTEEPVAGLDVFSPPRADPDWPE